MATEEYYRERAILAVERGDYSTAAQHYQHMKKAERAKQTKTPTDKYSVGTVIRFAQSWYHERDFYIVGLKIEEDKWLVYSRNAIEQNSCMSWNRMMAAYWDDSHSVLIFNEANGKGLKK